jgi:hypothetical protein
MNTNPPYGRIRPPANFHSPGAVMFNGGRRAALRDRIPSHFLSSRHFCGVAITPEQIIATVRPIW